MEPKYTVFKNSHRRVNILVYLQATNQGKLLNISTISSNTAKLLPHEPLVLTVPSFLYFFLNGVFFGGFRGKLLFFVPQEHRNALALEKKIFELYGVFAYCPLSTHII